MAELATIRQRVAKWWNDQSGGGGPSALRLQPAYASPQRGKRSSRPTQIDPRTYWVGNVCFAVRARDGGQSPAEKLLIDIILPLVKEGEKIFTAEEVAARAKIGMRTVRRLLDSLTTGPKPKLKKWGDKYHEIAFLDREISDESPVAERRRSARLGEFTECVSGTIKGLREFSPSGSREVDRRKISDHIRDTMIDKNIARISVLLADDEGRLSWALGDLHDTRYANPETPDAEVDRFITSRNQTGIFSFEGEPQLGESPISLGARQHNRDELVFFKMTDGDRLIGLMIFSDPLGFGDQKANTYLDQLQNLTSAAARAYARVAEAKTEKSATTPLPSVARGENIHRAFFDLMASYATRAVTRTFRNPRTGERRKVRVFSVPNPRNSIPKQHHSYIVARFKQVSAWAWKGERVVGPGVGYTEEFIERNFLGVKDLMLGFDPRTHELVFFTGLSVLEDDVRALEMGMAIPSHQDFGLASYTTYVMLMRELEANHMQPFTVGTRTANPRVLGPLTKHMTESFPNPHKPDATPSERFRSLAARVAAHLSPGIQFDPNTFVFKAVYSEESGLIYDLTGENGPPLPSYNKETDAYCTDRLALRERQGNAFLVLGLVDVSLVGRVIDSGRYGWVQRQAIRKFFLSGRWPSFVLNRF